MSQKQLLYYRLLQQLQEQLHQLKETATPVTETAPLLQVITNNYKKNFTSSRKQNSSTTGYYQQLQEQFQQLKETATHFI